MPAATPHSISRTPVLESRTEAAVGRVPLMMGPRPRDVWESSEDEFGSLRIFTANPTTFPKSLHSTLVIGMGKSHRVGVVGVVGTSATIQSAIIVDGYFSPRLYGANCFAKGLEFVACALEVVEQIAGSRKGVVGIGSSRRHVERKLSVQPDIKIANGGLGLSMVASTVKKRTRTYPSAFLTILRFLGQPSSNLSSLNERSSVLCARAGSKRSGWLFTVTLALQSFFASSWDYG